MPDLFPPANGRDLLELPPEPGFYFWVITDLNYLDVGAVQVTADPEKHLAYLRAQVAEKGADKVPFYLYQAADGRWLTMYYQAQDHMPYYRHPDGKPQVDGYRAFDFWALMNSAGPAWRTAMAATTPEPPAPPKYGKVPRRWRTPVPTAGHPNGSKAEWYYGCYFPQTDLKVGEMGGRGTGMPGGDSSPPGFEWLDPPADEPTAPRPLTPDAGLLEYPCCEGARRIERVPGDATTLLGGSCPVHGLSVNRKESP